MAQPGSTWASKGLRTTPVLLEKGTVVCPRVPFMAAALAAFRRGANLGMFEAGAQPHGARLDDLARLPPRPLIK